MQPEKFRYRVKGASTAMKHVFTDSEGRSQNKILREGDEVELTKMQAQALRNKLEPLDDAGKFDGPTSIETQLHGMREHEQLEVIEKEEQNLTERLETLRARKKQLEDTVKAKAAARQAAPEGKPAVQPKPQDSPGDKVKA